ncbi:MAG: hypothetical protein LIP05_15265 [Tannerellaceae bacterium]|nr:hypothetical protein [Tannerellaceae bacterium]MCC8132838.1 hypothetical protein [Tannerellaceae bacterium]MCC8199326.1 hypothetical protein [Tannerellaceae bacterium]
MATRRQVMRDIENKQAQAREQYAKNKNLLEEYHVKERSTDYIHPNKNQAGKK